MRSGALSTPVSALAAASAFVPSASPVPSRSAPASPASSSVVQSKAVDAQGQHHDYQQQQSTPRRVAEEKENSSHATMVVQTPQSLEHQHRDMASDVYVLNKHFDRTALLRAVRFRRLLYHSSDCQVLTVIVLSQISSTC